MQSSLWTIVIIICALSAGIEHLKKSDIYCML